LLRAHVIYRAERDGTVSYVAATDTATVHFPVPSFNPSYAGKGDLGGVGKGPIKMGQRILRPQNENGDTQWHVVEFGVATAGMIVATIAFEATPVGWAATGVGLVAYGCAGFDLWMSQ
jgi:hypothetical protein